MALAPNKTKIVCTIGPASESPEILRQMLNAGMNIARLNFSHGDFAWHKTVIENLRQAASAAGKRVTILADLPGPKMRIGQLAEEPIELNRDDAFTLTTEEYIGNRRRVSVSFPRLPFFYSDMFDLGYEAVGDVDSRLETFTDWKQPNVEGVVYYLQNSRVRGVLLWNVWDQVEAARHLIAAPGSFTAKDLKGRLPTSDPEK